jgi:hypothetical protein
MAEHLDGMRAADEPHRLFALLKTGPILAGRTGILAAALY